MTVVQCPVCYNCFKSETDMTKEELLDLIEDLHNGLQWYRDMHPEHYSPADDEIDARVFKAIDPSYKE